MDRHRKRPDHIPLQSVGNASSVVRGKFSPLSAHASSWLSTSCFHCLRLHTAKIDFPIE